MKTGGYEKLRVSLENGLLKLAESLEENREHGEWTDHLIKSESNLTYATE